MLQIFNMHNIVNHYSKELMTHKNCFDYFEFEKFIRNKEDRFIDLKKAIQSNKGNVLTIDDATMGAYNAALLCAVNKNYVTIFINPYYIEENRNYFMHYLSYFIEKLNNHEMKYDSIIYDLSKYKGRKYLRKAIKKDLIKIDNEEGRIKYLEKIFKQNINKVTLPYHLRTMNKKQLLMLSKNKYIRIEYHGWTHTCLSSMSIEQIITEMQKSEVWFKQNLDYNFNYFALPFGTRDKKTEQLNTINSFLLEGQKDEILPSNVINRTPLTL